MPSIFHIANPNSLSILLTQGSFDADSLATEGFIHCSTHEEVIATANRRFNEAANLLLWELDQNKIQAPVVFENTSGGSILYPHIYGSIPLSALVRVYHFNQDASGNFLFPTANDEIDFTTDKV